MIVALAGNGAKTPKVRARAGNSFTNLLGCHFFMAQM
jgi:hypothetical protein